MRVLIVYATSRGGTAGLARMLAEAFVAHAVAADVGEATAVDEIEGYDGIVVGGALYHGRWHSEATWFVERNLPALRANRVWFFSSGPLDDSARGGALAPVPQVRELARRADIRGHMTFGGVLDARPSGLLGSLLSYGPPGDYRDPQQVGEWVEWIVARLGEPREVTIPDVAPDPEPDGVAARMLHRLVTAGEDPDDADDFGLDLLAE